MGIQKSGKPLDTEVVADQLTALLEGRPEVRIAWLFGSRGRGTEGSAADVDLAVFCGGRVPDLPWGYQAHLSGEITKSLGTDAVDVVVMELAPPLLAHRVVRDGRLLVCRDEAERIRFVARTVLKYFDTKPLRELEAHYLARRHATPPAA